MHVACFAKPHHAGAAPLILCHVDQRHAFPVLRVALTDSTRLDVVLWRMMSIDTSDSVSPAILHVRWRRPICRSLLDFLCWLCKLYPREPA